jgi:hypothetical protein
MRTTHVLYLLFLPVVALTCSSCGAGRETVYPVTGQVFFEGKPAQGAVVVLHPAANANPSALHPQGTVGTDGTFRLTTYRKHDGAPPGDYEVTVTWTRPLQAGERDEVSILPPRYLRPGTSMLRCQVQPGPTTLQPFNLTR